MADGSGYRDRLLKEVEALSEERIKALADFAAYLREREDWEATAEILGNEEMTQDIMRSRNAWAQGLNEDFVSLEELKARLDV